MEFLTQLLKDGSASRKPRGGSHNVKLRDEDIDFIIGRLEVNPYLTLKEMCACLQKKKVKVSESAVQRKLEEHIYSIKRTYLQPIAMNFFRNKLNRKQSCTKILQLKSEGKDTFSLDETNVNFFL